MHFERLLTSQSYRSPGEQQRWARDKFSALLAESSLEELPSEEFVKSKGRTILLIVAVYSLNDLRLLDKLDELCSRQKKMAVGMYIYDIENINSQYDLDKFIPGILPAYQTPMIGIWENGELKKSAWGNDALGVLNDMFFLI
ncbi:MAG: hypothetical protein Q3M24_12550 [Candidatus Electrothrix aestuarii]|uniref:Uncharacterized protein n=1 Tax=Candidatus Electrothrix aestuarii TaxID=3062594 RepID=A0AAU8LNU7_9BACT